MAYLLDANVFIQAKNLHYGLDFCPAFWDWLIARNAAGLVFNIERVGDEIEAGADDLAKWAADRGPGFFVKPDAAMLPALGSVSAWATGQHYEPAAVNTFLQVADYYLVAQSLAHGHTFPLYGLTSVSTVNMANNIVSVSNDGRLCVWNDNNLAQPTTQLDLRAVSG